MSVPARDGLEIIAEQLASVLRRQDELDARCARIEAALASPAAPAIPPAAPPPLAHPWGVTGVAPPAPPGPPYDVPPGFAPGFAPPGPPYDVPPGFAPGFAPAGPPYDVPPGFAPAGPALAPLPTPSPWPVPGAPEPVPAPPRPAFAPGSQPLATTRATEAAAPPSFESQVGLQWLNRIGVITLILGVAFAYKTAVENDWIGPTARVALGVVAALAVLGFGDLQWRRNHTVFAQGLTGLGIALLYLSFGAACAVYHLIPQVAAFGLMVATTIAAGALALRYASQAIAVLGMIGGYATPIALSTGEPHALIFLGYLTLLNVSAIVLSRRRVWPVLEQVATVATAVLYAGWLVTSATPDERPIATVFAGVFYVQYAIAQSRVPWLVAQLLCPVVIAALWGAAEHRLPLLLAFALAGLLIAHRRRTPVGALWAAMWFWVPELCAAAVHTPPLAIEFAGASLAFAGFVAWIVWAHVHHRRALGGFDLALLIGNPAAYVAAAAIVLEPAHHAYVGGLVLVLTVVYLALGKLVWRAADPARDRRPLYVVFGVALVCFTVAAPLELDGFWITIAWALEAAGLAWLSRRHDDDPLDLAACGVLVLAIIALGVAGERADQLAPPALIVNLRFATFGVLAASLFASARLLRLPGRAIVTYVLGHLAVLLAIGLEVAAWLDRAVAPDDQPGALTVASSILMASYAVMLIVLGVVRRRARDRVMGLVLMAVVVVKLYASDVWSLGRGFEVAAFLGLGVLLLGVSYLYSRYRAVVGRIWTDEPGR